MGFIILNGFFSFVIIMAFPPLLIASIVWYAVRKVASRNGVWRAAETWKPWEWNRTGD